MKAQCCLLGDLRANLPAATPPRHLTWCSGEAFPECGRPEAVHAHMDCEQTQVLDAAPSIPALPIAQEPGERGQWRGCFHIQNVSTGQPPQGLTWGSQRSSRS